MLLKSRQISSRLLSSRLRCSGESCGGIAATTIRFASSSCPTACRLSYEATNSNVFPQIIFPFDSNWNNHIKVSDSSTTGETHSTPPESTQDDQHSSVSDSTPTLEEEQEDPSTITPQLSILKQQLRPLEVVSELNRHIVGQEDAKRAVAIAMRNRWRRKQLSPELRKEVTPRNVLMIGPTGCGKVQSYHISLIYFTIIAYNMHTSPLYSITHIHWNTRRKSHEEWQHFVMHPLSKSRLRNLLKLDIMEEMWIKSYVISWIFLYN